VKDLNGKDVWDATVHNNGLCMQMLSQMAQYTQKYNPTLKGGYVQTGYDLTNDFQKIGQADVGYYGPYFYTSNDVSFLNRVNTILVIVGIASLALAFLLGAIMSRRLSRPISKAIEAASEISRGNFKQRIKEQSTTREIKQLTATVNDLADSLEKQQQLRKTMAADVSHELRTPLASLQSSLEAIIDGIWEPSRERLESCHEEILRINRLVGDLEKLERAEAENTMLNMTELNLSELAQHIVHNFETDFFKKSVKLNFVCDSVAVKADRDKISQVIINLLSNALKYTQKGGRVELQVRDNGRSAKLIVSDTGNGISQDDIPNIFERLYRADKSRNRVTGGSGLGLTITKAIIEAHKGSISVSSELDKGTAFTVSLPKSRG
ncbi:MAG: ATP-binding protein, partial [Ethanoligenens sp.]